jgi:AraC-like DNA-binding protein
MPPPVTLATGEPLTEAAPATAGQEAARSPRIGGAPHPRLRPLLARGHAGFTEVTEPEQLILPAGVSVPLVLKVRDSAHRPPQFVGGPRATAMTLDGACAPAYLEVWLAPLGAYTLLGAPVAGLRGEFVDLADVFGPDGRRLGEMVREAPTWRRRFALVDDFLLGRAEVGPQPAPEVAHAWRRLVDTGGRAAIGALAREIGWSHRHLVARFREQVGVTPKTAARLIRFDRVGRLLGEPSSVRWADVAAEAGYADQSHLVREFRTFTGMTPGGYLESVRAA